MIVDKSLDILAVVESWHDAADSPSVIASTPNGYCVVERARPRTATTSLASNHGGICIFTRRDIRVSITDLPSYKSFELLSVNVFHGPLSFMLAVIYRPDPASSLTVNDDFFTDFADVLERSSTFARCVIVGDVNIHLDDVNSVHTSRFLRLVDDFGLQDVVRQPSHCCGHQLDVLITRTDQPVASVTVDPPLMSDHSLITATFNETSFKTSTDSVLVWRRQWRQFDYDIFIDKLKSSSLVMSTPSDVVELVDCYNETLTTLLDETAPKKQVRLKASSSAPWFDADCRHCKAATRKLEKVYRRKPSEQSRSAWQTQFSRQRELFQTKMVSYWTTTIDSCRGNAKALWSKLRRLLEPQSDTVTDLTADDLARYFVTKIERIRASTAAAPAPNISDRVVPERLTDLAPVTAEEVVKILAKSPAKQCRLDPAPTWLVKRASDILAPVIASVCNASFDQARFPALCKQAIVRPLLKKCTMDVNDPGSYRPISNLSFLSKIVEKVVDARLTEHVEGHRLLPAFQSAYRPFHSTETAVVSILNDMLTTVDKGRIGALMLLDLSAAFDTVDHAVLTDVLRRRFGITGKALDWFDAFLSDRHQSIHLNGATSEDTTLLFGVPQGSVIGPKAFIQYAEDVSEIFCQHNIHHHLFADDMQGHSNSLPKDAAVIVTQLSSCVEDICDWCEAKRLQLNAGKTELLWFGSASQLRQLPQECKAIIVNQTVIEPSDVVRNLGVWIDANLSMREHVSRVARTCFFHLRRLRSLRRQLGRDVTARLVTSLVLARLDYCNAILVGLPKSTLSPLQRVIHAAARVVLNLRPRDHVTPALLELHWLPIVARIDYKLCLLVHKALVGHAPQYIKDLITPVADLPSRASLRTARSGDLIVPRTSRKFGDRAFAVAAPRAWNRLPTELKLQRSTTSFKRRLKTVLFNHAFSSANT